MSCAEEGSTETIPRTPEMPAPNSRMPGSSSCIFVSVSENEFLKSLKRSFVSILSHEYFENDFIAFSNYDQGKCLVKITFRNRVP